MRYKPQKIITKDNWTFVLRDDGQKLKISDYDPVYTGKDALKALHRGKFISAQDFLDLCRKNKVRMRIWTRAKLLYLNEFEVSITTLRHRSHQNLTRFRFDGTFTAISELIAVTIGQAYDTHALQT